MAAALAICGCSSPGGVRPELARAEAAAGIRPDDSPRGAAVSRPDADHAAAGLPSAAPLPNVPEAAAQDYAAAVAAMQAGDWVDAEARLERLSALYPSLPGPYVNAAIVYRHGGRDDDAIAALDKALALAPGHPAANNQLGILLRGRGDFTGAEKAYRKALETEPDYALALYNIGVLLDLYLRRPAEAVEYYERYQAALPAPDETVARWIVDLKRRAGGNADARVAREAGQ
jgi:Flp pilus assembly protein TadD